MAARFVPILFLAYGLSFLFPLGAVAWERVRAEIPWVAVFLGAAALVAAPLLIHFALHPEHFFLRSKHLWVFAPETSQGDPLRAFLTNVLGSSSSSGRSGGPELAEQLRWSANAEPMGSSSFSGSASGMALWLLAAVGPPIASYFSGRAMIAPAGIAGPRWPGSQHQAHVGRSPGHLSAVGCRRVGGVPIHEGTVLRGTRDQGWHRRGECIRHRSSDARDHHASNILYPVGGCPRGA